MRAAALPLVAVALLAGCGGSAGDPVAGSPDGAPAASACDETRTLTCAWFDVASGAWNARPPQRMSIASACSPSGANGEIDAYVVASGRYQLDRVGFTATGSAVRPGML